MLCTVPLKNHPLFEFIHTDADENGDYNEAAQDYDNMAAEDEQENELVESVEQENDIENREDANEYPEEDIPRDSDVAMDA